MVGVAWGSRPRPLWPQLWQDEAVLQRVMAEMGIDRWAGPAGIPLWGPGRGGATAGGVSL